MNLAEVRSAIDEVLGDRCKVQILGGQVVASPLTSDLHPAIVNAVRRMLDAGCGQDEYSVNERAVVVADEDNSPQPDLTVLRTGAVAHDPDAKSASQSTDVELVVEVTSPGRADGDRKWGSKYRAYAIARVAMYLLVDPHAQDEPLITLYTRPNGSRYLAEYTVPFGEPLTLPAPFDGVTIDGSRFPTP